MSKKGAFVYQQIELTTAEWAVNETVYPASVWLFERLADGKFNMKLSDGVHTFAQLPAVMQDVKVTVKTNNATTYILTVATAEGEFDTPNLRAQNYTHPAFTTRSSGLYKITVNNQGHVTDVAVVTKEDITALGIPGQDTDTTYGNASASAAGLMSPTDKARLDDALVFKEVTTAITLTGLSIGNYSIKVTLTAASALSFASIPYEGWECMIDIKNASSSDITQPIPNATGWQCDETSITIAAGKIASISVRYVHGTYVVITKGH